jgi:hypothetical protein
MLLMIDLMVQHIFVSFFLPLLSDVLLLSQFWSRIWREVIFVPVLCYVEGLKELPGNPLMTGLYNFSKNKFTHGFHFFNIPYTVHILNLGVIDRLDNFYFKYFIT